MFKTKVIRGKPIYLYKGKQYLYKPDGTYIKKMLYDDVENTTYVRCARHTRVPELICIFICVLCVLLNVLYIHGVSYCIKYNSMVVYYKGQLYLNITNDEDNVFDINVSLLDNSNEIYSCVLEPGTSLISIPIEDVKESYTLSFEYETFVTRRVSDVNINVLNRGD